MSEPVVAITERDRPSGVGAESARRWWILGVVGLAQLMVILDRMTAHYRRARHRLDRLAEERRGHSPLHPQSVATAVDRLADADAIFTADVGTPCIWAARYLRMNGRRRLIGSFNHGSMANALPQAIGAQASHPGRQVITLSGDGGGRDNAR